MRPSAGKHPMTHKGSFLWFLRKYYATHLNPNLKFKIVQGENGFEIHSKTDNLNALKTELRGEGRLIPVQLQDKFDHQRLLDKSLEIYPSLIDIDGRKAIFWGPLALANHDCMAKLAFEFLDGEGE